MKKRKLLNTGLLLLGSAIVIAGGTFVLNARMSYAKEQTEVTEISQIAVDESVLTEDVDDFTEGSEQVDDYCYDIEWNGKSVMIVETGTRSQEGDIDYGTAIDKAAEHVKKISGQDVSDSYIHLVLTSGSTDEGEGSDDYGENSHKRSYYVIFEADGYGCGGGYRVDGDAITGEIFQYNNFNMEPTYESEPIIDEVLEAECTDIASEFIDKQLNLGKVESTYGFVVNPVGGECRYVIDFYCKTEGGDIVHITIDDVDREVYGYFIQ